MTLHTLSTSYFLVTLTALKPSLWSYFTFSFLQNLSRRRLNESTKGACFTWSGRVFQIATILWLKLYFLILVFQRSWYSASEFLPGLPVISIVIFIAGQICFSWNPLSILYVLIISPLNLLYYKVGSFSIFNLSLHSV